MKLRCVCRSLLCAVLMFGGLLPAELGAQSLAKTPEHPVTPEQVKQMMAITHATDRMRDGIHKMIAQQKSALPYFPEGFWADFEAEMAKVDWVAVATPIYQKYLSTEDADKAIAFYSTESGQRSLDSSMAVVEEMQMKGFELGKAAGEKLGEKYQAEIQENARKMQQSSAPPK